MLTSGVTEITYQIQVDNIKNAFSGQCNLWGMYDDIYLSVNPIVLENIPRKYLANDSVYQDLIKPSILNASVKQSLKTPNIEFQINVKAIDNNIINKIRVVFSQNSGWRAQTQYSMEYHADFSIVITNLKNVNSIVTLFIEVSDIYGNTATMILLPIRITVYELIPYLIVGIIVGFSIGIASISSILYRKLGKKKQRSDNELIEKSKERFSFLDDSD